MNSGRGGQSPKKNVEDLGLALAPKMCPGQSQTVKEVNNSQAFTVGRQKIAPVFSGRAASRCSKAWLYKVSPKYSKNWLRRTNIKSYLTPEIEPTLKPSNYDAKPWFCTLPRKSPNVHAVFERWDPEILHTCLMCPCRALYACFFVCFFFPEMWGPLRPKYPQKYILK